jgi:hypothetical protein
MTSEPIRYECGDCGDAIDYDTLTHKDDGTPMCSNRDQADARRRSQGRPTVSPS